MIKNWLILNQNEVKKGLLVPDHLAMQWKETLCIAVFTVMRRSSAFAKVSSELFPNRKENLESWWIVLTKCQVCDSSGQKKGVNY